MPSHEEQIQAILDWNTFRWAQSHLPESKTIDDVRFRDLISVTEDDVYAYCCAMGFRTGLSPKETLPVGRMTACVSSRSTMDDGPSTTSSAEPDLRRSRFQAMRRRDARLCADS